MRIHQPIGTLLLLWPTMWALWVAGKGQPSLNTVLLFCLGVFVMRSAGCVINDYADRHFDGAVERTKQRPLALGQVSPREALALFIFLIAIAFMIVISFNVLTIKLAFIAVLLASFYPFTKRFFATPQLILGLAFAWAIPMAFAAETGRLPLACWLLFAAAVLWPLVYDTMYAMVDRKDDLKIGIKSTAILFGQYDRLCVAIIQGLFVTTLIILGYLLRLNIAYYYMLSSVIVLFVYQQYLIRDRQPANCFKAFKNNHWVGLLIFIGFVLSSAN